MSSHRGENSKEPFTLTAPPGDQWRSDDSSGRNSRHPVPKDWRPLSTGLRGARLCHVTLPGGSGFCWEAEMTLNGKLLHRHFGSELHARAWLSATTESGSTPSFVDLEEVNGPLRASFFARDG
jgi:hypothetical protein